MDVSCSGFMETGSRRSLGFLPMASTTGVLPLKVTSVFLTVAALHINWAGVICGRVVWSRLFEAVSTSDKRNFLNSRSFHFCSVRPWCMWFCWNSVHVVHSVECLQVVRMVEKPCLHKLPADSSGMYPSIHEVLKLLPMERYSLHRVCCQMRCSTIQGHQESKGFVSNLRRPIISKNGVQILLHDVRSREIFQVLALLNCRIGMSSPRVDRGHKSFQEYPNEWSSS